MKHIFSALVTSETLPDQQATGPLLVFLDQLVYYQPTEQPHPRISSLTANDVAEGISPLPLGADLGRFTRLTDEMRQHGREYCQSYLENLPQPTAPDRDEASTERLAATLAGRRPTDASGITQSDQEKERIWQARLLLVLAEKLIEEEDDLSRQMQAIDQQKKNLLASLQGEFDDAEESDEDLNEFLTAGQLQRRHADSRLFPILNKAWATFHLRDSACSAGILLAHSPDAAQFLLDGYEKYFKTAPTELCSLHLPLTPWVEDEEYAEIRSGLRATLAPFRQHIAASIHAYVTGSETLTATAASLPATAAGWNAAITQHSGLSLSVYALDGADSRRLCARLLHDTILASAPPASPHTILLVVSS